MNRISSISRVNFALSAGVAVGLLLVAASFQSQLRSLANAARNTSAVSPPLRERRRNIRPFRAGRPGSGAVENRVHAGPLMAR